MDKLSQNTVSNIVLLIIVFTISALFLWMVKPFLMTIFLAGIFSGVAYPLFAYFEKKFKQRQGLASAITVCLLFFVILIPLMFLMAVVAGQAVQVSQSVTPWVKETISEPGDAWLYLQSLPFYENLIPYREAILEKAGGAVSFISKFLVGKLSAVTLGAVNFIFLLFVFLYSMFFFLIDGKVLVKKILYYLPLGNADEKQLFDRFTSVTKATVKGTFLIGVLQGSLSGIAFAFAGIPNAVFWAVVMAVLSIIPSIGSALIWIPAGIYLITQDAVVAGVLLLLFCGLVVGSLDNVLRPRLVGQDTQMHDLMIFFSTLGGIILFGFVGIVVGPIIASLFVTVWDIYGVTFKRYLPEVK